MKCKQVVWLFSLIFFIGFQNSYGYDVYQVIRYADKWVDPYEAAKYRNPRFNDYDDDCANFVSQCLIAGGIDLKDGPAYNIHGNHVIIRAGDWPSPGLGEHLEDNHGVTFAYHDQVDPDSIPDAPSGLGAGDVIIFGIQGDKYKHSVIVVGGYGNSAYCNSHTKERWHRPWTDFVDGTLPDPYSKVTFFEIPSDAGSKANLSYHTPSGWEAPLIASSVPGTNTNGPDFIAGEPTYIDWAIINDGAADLPDTIYYKLHIDGWIVQKWYALGLWYGSFNYVEDYEYTFSEGWHTLEIQTDPDDYWDELYESDNFYSYSEYWGPTGVDIWDVTVRNKLLGAGYGGEVKVDYIVHNSPFDTTLEDGQGLTIEAFDQDVGGTFYYYDHWIPEGAQSHYVQPSCNMTYTAHLIPHTPPSAPSNLRCESDHYMHWTDNSFNELAFHIWEGEPTSSDPACHQNWEYIGAVGANVTRWCKPSSGKLVPPCGYHYKVRAYNEWDPSGFSNTIASDCGGCSTSGCPYVYLWDGEGFVEDNTILGESEICGGTEPDVTDYYKLEQALVQKDGQYLIQIREFEHEHSYFDQLKLLAVDHPGDVLIGVNSEGEIIPYTRMALPISCVNDSGQGLPGADKLG